MFKWLKATICNISDISMETNERETATRGGAGITSFIGAREHALRHPGDTFRRHGALSSWCHRWQTGAPRGYPALVRMLLILS